MNDADKITYLERHFWIDKLIEQDLGLVVRTTQDLKRLEGCLTPEVKTSLRKVAAFYQGRAERLKRRRQEIEKVIAVAADPRHRELLHYRYIKMETWESVADIMAYSRSNIHRIHKAAIAALNIEPARLKSELS